MSTHTRSARKRSPWLVWVLSGVIALLLVALGLSLAIVIPALRQSDTFSLTVGKPTIVSEQQLRQYGADNATVYWAGPIPDRQYELTRSSAGATFIRYLSEGVKAGSESKYLTVATYPQENGYLLLQRSVTSTTITSQTTKSGALVVINPKTELSTYFSFPKANFQVEVFSPTKGESKDLVLDGKVSILGAK